MKRMIALALAFAAPWITACGSGSFNGKVSGSSLTVKSMALFTTTTTVDSIDTVLYSVFVSDEPDICNSYKTNTLTKDGAILKLSLITTDSNGLPTVDPANGKFSVAADGTGNSSYGNNANVANAEFEKLGDDCLLASPDLPSAQSGSVTLDSTNAHTGGTTAGTFDLTFTTSDHVTGSFSAPFCDFDFTAAPESATVCK